MTFDMIKGPILVIMRKKIKFVLSDNLILKICAFIFVVGFHFDLSANYKWTDSTKTVQSDKRIEFHVEELPTFRAGDLNLFINYVRKEIKYPISIWWTKHNRQIIVKFIVTKKGKVDSLVFIKNSGFDELDKEILRVISKTKDWSPAMYDGLRYDKEMEMTFKVR